MRADGGYGIPNFLTGLFAFVLYASDLLPAEPLWRRIAYTIIPTVLVWLTLRWAWTRWNPDAAAEDRARRTVAGGIAGAALVGAVLALTAKHHYECTQEVRSADGMECVGDYVNVAGPDRGLAFGWGLVAFLGIRFAIKPDEDRSA